MILQTISKINEETCIIAIMTIKVLYITRRIDIIHSRATRLSVHNVFMYERSNRAAHLYIR